MTKEEFNDAVAGIIANGRLMLEVLNKYPPSVDGKRAGIASHDPVLAGMLKRIDTEQARSLQELVNYLTNRTEN